MSATAASIAYEMVSCNNKAFVRHNPYLSWLQIPAAGGTFLGKPFAPRVSDGDSPTSAKLRCLIRPISARLHRVVLSSAYPDGRPSRYGGQRGASRTFGIDVHIVFQGYDPFATNVYIDRLREVPRGNAGALVVRGSPDQQPSSSATPGRERLHRPKIPNGVQQQVMSEPIQ